MCERRGSERRVCLYRLRIRGHFRRPGERLYMRQQIVAAGFGETMIELACLAVAFGVGWYLRGYKKKRDE